MLQILDLETWLIVQIHPFWCGHPSLKGQRQTENGFDIQISLFCMPWEMEEVIWGPAQKTNFLSYESRSRKKGCLENTFIVSKRWRMKAEITSLQSQAIGRNMAQNTTETVNSPDPCTYTNKSFVFSWRKTWVSYRIALITAWVNSLVVA